MHSRIGSARLFSSFFCLLLVLLVVILLAVSFGSTAATNMAIQSDTQLTVTCPAGTGTVDVTVTTQAGTSATSPADQFSYVILRAGG